MHRRKKFIFYPDGYKVCHGNWVGFKSKIQAFKCAKKRGGDVIEFIYVHPSNHKDWTSSFGGREWSTKHD